jgi:hypothetical protein
MALPIHIGLNQHRLVPVTGLPVAGHLAQGQPVALAGQIGYPQPPADQKAR